jgi:glycosyltransferase involved in cell wall biosynthesis
MSLVTIGLSVYNAEKYLYLAISSVLKQTYVNFEFIIIDDGSTDSSVEIIKSFKDDRILFISDGMNKGLPFRLNQIVELAKGDYVARMDADDIMFPERIETQLEILSNNPDIDILGSNAIIINEKNTILGVRSLPVNEEIIDVKGFIHPTIIGKKNWFVKNPYDVKAIRIEDGELWFRTIEESKFCQYMSPLLYYRELDSKVYVRYKKGIPSFFYVFYKYLKSKKNKKAIIWLFKTFIYIFKYFFYLIVYLLNLEVFLLKKRFVKINHEKYKNESSFVN